MRTSGAIVRSHVTVFLGLCLLGTGCVSLRQHNPSHGAKIPESLYQYATHIDQSFDSTPAPFTPEERAYLSRPFVIEFDDEGELWEQPAWLNGKDVGVGGPLSQFERARAAIRLARSRSANLTVLVFVHGWKHDANLDDFNAGRGNLASFTSFIVDWNAKLAERTPADTHNPPLCLGVFIAWRGTPWTAMRAQQRSPISLLNQVPLNLTIWNRLAAADRVGRSTATQVMLTLAGEAKRDHRRSSADETLGRDPTDAAQASARYEPGRVVFVGHSMGARILEHSLAQAIVGARFLAAPQAQAEHQAAVEEIGRLEVGLETSRRALAAARDAHGRHHASWKELERESGRTSEQARLQRERAEQLAARKQENEKRGYEAAKSWLVEKFKALFGDPAIPPPAEQSAEERLSVEIQRIDDAIARLQRTPADDPSETLAAELGQIRDGLVQVRAAVADARTREAAAAAALQDSLANEKQMAAALEAARARVDLLNAELTHCQKEVGRHEASLAQAKRRRDAALARPADLILLFNPASEAIVTRQIAHALNAPAFQLGGPEDHLPWIISVTSDADIATRGLYPLGAFFRGLVREHRTDNEQYRYFSSPAPHIREFCNFELKFVQSLDARNVTDDSVEDWIGLNLKGPALDEWLRKHPQRPVEEIKKPSRPLTAEDKDLVIAAGGIYALERRPANPGDVHYHPAYWVINADRGLIREHNDEFSPRAHALVSALLRISETLPRTTAASRRDEAATEQKAAAEQKAAEAKR